MGELMANWTTATLLKRLAAKLAEAPDIPAADPDEIIRDPKTLGEVMASEIIELLRAEVVREAMDR